MERKCTIDGCDRKHESRGYCAMHAKRARKHGDPLRVDPPKPYKGRSVEASLATLLARREFTPTDCWEYTGTRHPTGYGYMSYQGRPWRVPRLAWTLLVGPIPEGLAVCHRCDNPPCFNPEHLFLDTLAGNNADMDRKGRARRVGFKRQPNFRERATKLTPDDVLAIRASNEPNGVLAERYGITKPYVCNIKAGRKGASVV